MDYAYIDQMDNSKNPKYRTNMVISDSRDAFDDREIKKRASLLLCDAFFPAIFDEFDADSHHWGLSCDGEDLNFLHYHLLLLGMLRLQLSDVGAQVERLRVKRPDGGDFIAFASVSDLARRMEEEMFEGARNYYPGHMLPSIKSIYGTNSLASTDLIPRVAEILLARGVLKPLAAIQAQGRILNRSSAGGGK